MSVEDKPTFKEQFEENKIDNKRISISHGSKAYIDDLLIKTDIIPKIEIVPGMAKQDPNTTIKCPCQQRG